MWCANVFFVWLVSRPQPGVVMAKEGVPRWACVGPAAFFIVTLGALGFPLPATSAHAPPAAPLAPAPDLVPVDITPTPPIVHEDEILRVSVTIENRGDLAAWAATVVLVDLQPNGDVSTIPTNALSAPLDPGASVVVQIRFIVVAAGEHTLTARVVEVLPTDADSTNDALSIRMEVLPRAAGGGGSEGTSDGIRISALEGLGIAGLVVLVLIAVLGVAVGVLSRGPPREPLVPPPPEPEDRHPPPIWPP